MNLRLDRYASDPRTRMINVRRALTEPAVNPERADDRPTFGIYLSVYVGDADAAVKLARRICAALRHLRELDVGLTAVSPADDITSAARIFCDNSVPSGRCALPPGHPESCGARP